MLFWLIGVFRGTFCWKHTETILPEHALTAIQTETNGKNPESQNYIVRLKTPNSRTRGRRKTCRVPRFVPLGKTGFNEIRAVETAGQRNRWTDGMLRDELSHEHGFHFGVRLPPGKELCAFVLCRLFAGELHIHRLCTRPAERRKGFARALLRHVFTAAGNKGAGKVFLEVNALNDPAVSLYLRLGFAIDTERKKYYRDGDDALVMSRVL
jgi:[ribosomal protein S18]-alanine N-acetyltransferase